MSIKLYFADNFKIGEPTNSFKDIIDGKTFEKNNIKIVDTIRDSNLIIAGRLCCEIIHSKRPVIICERYDSSSIGVSYNYYSSGQVKSVFKNYLPRDKKMLLESTNKKRYHYHLLSKIYSDIKDDELVVDRIEPFLDKFRQVTWRMTYTHLPINKHMKYCVDNRNKVKKDIDIFCVCHDHVDLLKTHRYDIKAKVNKLKEKYNLNIVCGNGLNQNDYHNNLIRSKICVCPWGLGERIACDQKGILAGCVLIKPDSNFVLTYPDLYKDEYYVSVKQDLSNLVEVCMEVLGNYEKYLEKTNKAFEMLQEVTHNHFVEIFCKNINDVFSSL